MLQANHDRVFRVGLSPKSKPEKPRFAIIDDFLNFDAATLSVPVTVCLVCLSPIVALAPSLKNAVRVHGAQQSSIG